MKNWEQHPKCKVSLAQLGTQAGGRHRCYDEQDRNLQSTCASKLDNLDKTTVMSKLDNIGQVGQFEHYLTVWTILDNIDNFGQYGQFWTIWTILDNFWSRPIELKYIVEVNWGQNIVFDDFELDWTI